MALINTKETIKTWVLASLTAGAYCIAHSSDVISMEGIIGLTERGIFKTTISNLTESATASMLGWKTGLASMGTLGTLGLMAGGATLAMWKYSEHYNGHIYDMVQAELDTRGYSYVKNNKESIDNAVKDMIRDTDAEITNNVLNTFAVSESGNASFELSNTARQNIKSLAKMIAYDYGTFTFDNSYSFNVSSDAEFYKSMRKVMIEAGLLGSSGALAISNTYMKYLSEANYAHVGVLFNKLTGAYCISVFTTSDKVASTAIDFVNTLSSVEPQTYVNAVRLRLYDENGAQITRDSQAANNRIIYSGKAGGYNLIYSWGYQGTMTFDKASTMTSSHDAYEIKTYNPDIWEGIEKDAQGFYDNLKYIQYKTLVTNSIVGTTEKAEVAPAVKPYVKAGTYSPYGYKNKSDVDERDKIDGIPIVLDPATVQELADALGLTPDEVIARLKELIGTIPEVKDETGTKNPVKPDVDTKTQEKEVDDNADEKTSEKTPPYTPPTIPISKDVGLFTLYHIGQPQLKQLAQSLWNGGTGIESIKTLFSNPIDSIISLCAYPFQPTVDTSSTEYIHLGGFDTGVYGDRIGNLFQTIDLGSVKINEKFTNYLDYSPYTRISIYLPFIGIVDLDTNDVMNSTISVSYGVEFITGTCLAMIKVQKTGLNAVMYQYSGTIGMQIPITAQNFGQIYKSVIGAIASVGSAIVTKGVTAPIAIGAVSNLATNSKIHVQRSGNLQGNSGMVGGKTPYIIIERPIPNIPSSYSKLNGVVSNTYSLIGSLSGYVELSNFDLSTIKASNEELAEIQEILRSGFII